MTSQETLSCQGISIDGEKTSKVTTAKNQGAPGQGIILHTDNWVLPIPIQ